MSKGKAIPCGDAVELVQPLLDVLGSSAKLAGSLRRGKERVRDVDIVVAEAVDLDAVQALGAKVLEAGKEKIRMIVPGDLQVDIVVTDPEHHGAAWLYLTGPSEFNMAMRSRAKDDGFKLNQRDLVRRETDEVVAAATEREIFAALGLKYVLAPKRSGDSLYPLATEGVVFKIPSRSNPGDVYDVEIRDGHGICRCRGYLFCKDRPKHCFHTDEATRQLAEQEAA